MTATLPDTQMSSLPSQRFSTRHIGPQVDDREKMLAALGLDRSRAARRAVTAAVDPQHRAACTAARTFRVRDVGGAA